MSMSFADMALLTCRQMAAADAAAVQAGIPEFELMLNAGRAVTDAINARWKPGRATVACGPGNNGGDGFVIARLLQESGWAVRLALLGHVSNLLPAACAHAGQWTGPVEALDRSLLQADLVVDALFGAGLSRPLEGDAARWISALTETSIPVCAVDIPSGVSGDTGQALGLAARADLTVTFFRKKIGHVLSPGRQFCGELVLADIGIPAASLADLDLSVAENHPGLWRSSLPQAMVDQHKYHRGHVLVRGGDTLTGAARLSALAAARTGAGLVTIAAPSAAWPVYAASLLSIMVQRCDDASTWSTQLEDARINSMVVGPGAGQDVAAYALAALGTARPVVLDADALTAFADQPHRLFDAIKGPCVLTPHTGEFNRLFPAKEDNLDNDKLVRTQRAARQSGAIVTHKGSDTVIAHPDGRAIINTSGHPALATAGTGDVLTGMIAGFLAQGMDAFAAASAACWLHGQAGSLSGLGLIADDLPGLIPGLLQTLAHA